MTTRIGVVTEAPLPGRCLRGLLAAHPEAWVLGLHAAMLRDTLDGLQSIAADAYEVLVTDAHEEAVAALSRHVPAPWQIVAIHDASAALLRLVADGGTGILARSDAPSAPVDPITSAVDHGGDAFALLGPASTGGSAWLIGGRGLTTIAADLPWGTPELSATMRVRCTKASLPLVELPGALVVDEPSAVLSLLDELRAHPERAPRTAQYVVTHA